MMITARRVPFNPGNELSGTTIPLHRKLSRLSTIWFPGPPVTAKHLNFLLNGLVAEAFEVEEETGGRARSLPIDPYRVLYCQMEGDELDGDPVDVGECTSSYGEFEPFEAGEFHGDVEMFF